MISGVVAGYLVTGGDYKGAIVGGVAGVIPDLDEPNSKFGKMTLPISVPLNNIFGHRTFTHSLLFVSLNFITFFFLIFTELWIALAVSSGILAHILGDMLTGKVKFLYPSQKSIGIRIKPSMFVPIDRVARYSLFAYFVILVAKDFNIL